MRLRDYFAGIPIFLDSSRSPDAVAEAINNAAGSPFWPFNFGVVGRVRFGRLSMRYRSSIFEYNAKPVLVGKVREVSFGSKLTLRYRAPVPIYAFFIFWYSFLALFAVGLVGSAMKGEVRSNDLMNAAAINVFLLILILPMHYIGTRNSDQELSELIDFLQREADAKPLT